MLRKRGFVAFHIPSFTPISGDVISSTEFWFRKKISGLDIILYLTNSYLKSTYITYSLKNSTNIDLFLKSQVLDLILNILHSFPINSLRHIFTYR